MDQLIVDLRHPPDYSAPAQRLPAGTWVFETSARDGACGYALEADTYPSLLDEAGTVVAENDDLDSGAIEAYCSRITRELAAGTYRVRSPASRPGRTFWR